MHFQKGVLVSLVWLLRLLYTEWVRGLVGLHVNYQGWSLPIDNTHDSKINNTFIMGWVFLRSSNIDFFLDDTFESLYFLFLSFTFICVSSP